MAVLAYADFIGKYNHLVVGLFRGSANGAGLIPATTMQELVQDIADSFGITIDDSVKNYNDITALLANTDMVLKDFAYVADASADPAVAEGWALYLLVISDPTDLASYILISKQYVSSGTSMLIDTAYDASGDTFKSTGGTGPGGAIRKGNYYFVGTASTTVGLFPTGVLVTALADNPGQTAGNWNVNY